MKNKISKMLMMIMIPAIAILTLGIFVVNEFVLGFASASSEKIGGCFIVQSQTRTVIDGNSKISGFSANNGGAIYVSSGGELEMDDGTIYRNTATQIENSTSTGFGGGVMVSSGAEFTMLDGKIYSNSATTGKNVFNGGTFTMNDGTIGGKIVEFGSYPQTIKADNVTIDKTKTNSNGYYLGSDGNYYGLYSSSYYKVEPIKWRILSVENGKVLLLSENVLTNLAYYKSSLLSTFTQTALPGGGIIIDSYAEENKYSDSYIRTWLNGTFYNDAFTSTEKTKIQQTEVDNSASTTSSSSNSYACDNTTDKVFLLSYSELKNTDYLFSSETNNDVLREKTATDFANAHDSYYSSSSKGTLSWWTRSPGAVKNTYASYVGVYGNLLIGTVTYSLGVVPSIVVSSSALSNLYDDEVELPSEDVTIPSGYGIYNEGTMNLNGGLIYDDIYSSNSFTMGNALTIKGKIALSDSAIITVSDYDGATPKLNIVVSEKREPGTILKLTGSSTAPDLSNLKVVDSKGNELKIKSVESKTEVETFEIKLMEFVTLEISKDQTSVKSFEVDGVTYTNDVTLKIEKEATVAIKAVANDGYGGNGYYLNKIVGTNVTNEYAIWNPNNPDSDVDGACLVMDEESISVKVYARPNEYQIYYCVNLPSGDTVGSWCKSYTYGKKYQFDSNSNYNGYQIVKWTTSKDGSGDEYLPGNSFKNLTTKHNGIVNLYAECTNVKITVTISGEEIFYYYYDINAYYSDENMTKQITSISIPTSSDNKTFFGYKSYNTVYVNSSGNIINNLYKVNSDTNEISLTAIWKEIVTVYLESSNSSNLQNALPSGGGTTPASPYVDGTSVFYYSIDDNAFYSQKNCYDSDKISSITVPTIDKIYGDPNAKFFGFWTKVKGDDDNLYFDVQYIPASGILCEYDSKGLATNSVLATGIKEDDIINNNYTLTLYPNWNTTKITFNVNSDEAKFYSGFDDNDGAETKTKWATNLVVGETPTPVRQGYALVGWYTDSKDGIKITETTALTDYEVTYYAQWVEMNVATKFISGADHKKYIYYGYYPQSKKYSDVEVDESKTITSLDIIGYLGSDLNWYVKEGSDDYYLIEPILWQIEANTETNEANTETKTVATMVPDIILDVYAYEYVINKRIEWDAGVFMSNIFFVSYIDKVTAIGRRYYDGIGTDTFCNVFVKCINGESVITYSRLFSKADISPGGCLDKLVYKKLRTPSAYAYAKGGENSYYWLDNNPGFVWKTNENENSEFSYICIDFESNVNYGIVPIITIPLHKLKETTIEETLTSSGHIKKKEKKCSDCKYSCENTITHSVEVTKGTTITYRNEKGHWYVDTVKCTVCSSKETTEDRCMVHMMKNNRCVTCNWSPLFNDGSSLSFSHSTNHHCDDENCLSQAVLCQDVLIDDKKKYSTEVVLEEKRYSNDVVQLPRVGT